MKPPISSVAEPARTVPTSFLLNLLSGRPIRATKRENPKQQTVVGHGDGHTKQQDIDSRLDYQDTCRSVTV